MAERTPVTSAVMAMTAAMPITTPRAVSAVRPRLWASGRQTLSRTVSRGRRLKLWNTKPMHPARTQASSASVSDETSSPSSR